MISYVEAVKKNWGHFTKVITYVSYKMKYLVEGSRELWMVQLRFWVQVTIKLIF